MLDNIKVNFRETRSYLRKIGFAGSDHEQVNNASQFESGGHYGIELSSMNNLKTLIETLKLAKTYQIKIDRFIECRGIMRLPDAEILAMVDLCQSEHIGLILSIGPRAINDLGGFVRSNNGKLVGYRLRGMENIIYAVEDVKRAIALGVRGFLIYDEGLLFLLNRMRQDGELPKNIIYKYSVHAACSNPLSAKLLAENGADSINVIPDLTVEMIRSFRKAIKTPLDVFSDTAKEAGGFIRNYDIPEVIRYASPLYLKCGPISQQYQNHLPTSSELEERVKQTRNVIEHVERYLPEASIVSAKEYTLAIPNTTLVFTKNVFERVGS